MMTMLLGLRISIQYPSGSCMKATPFILPETEKSFVRHWSKPEAFHNAASIKRDASSACTHRRANMEGGDPYQELLYSKMSHLHFKRREKRRLAVSKRLPSSGFLTNVTPCSSNSLQAAYTSGTAIPMCPETHHRQRQSSG